MLNQDFEKQLYCFLKILYLFGVLTVTKETLFNEENRRMKRLGDRSGCVRKATNLSKTPASATVSESLALSRGS